MKEFKKMPKMAIGGKISAPVGNQLRNKAVSFLKPAIKNILSYGKPKPAPGYNTYPPARTPGSNNIPSVNPTITSAPKPPPSAPMAPVLGGGTAPASVAPTMKKGGKARRNKK